LQQINFLKFILYELNPPILCQIIFNVLQQKTFFPESADIWIIRMEVGGEGDARRVIAKLENDRAGRKPSSDTWHTSRCSDRRSWPFFFSRGTESRTKGRDERAVKMTSGQTTICKPPLYITNRRRSCKVQKLINNSALIFYHSMLNLYTLAFITISNDVTSPIRIRAYFLITSACTWIVTSTRDLQF